MLFMDRGRGVSRRVRGGVKMRAADLPGEIMSPQLLNQFEISNRVE